MSRNLVSICLSVIFLVFLVAPTVITLVDNSADVSLFYEVSEEEEKSGEKDSEVENFFLDLQHHDFDNTLSNSDDSEGYLFKKYAKPHLNLISPPPDLHLL